MSIQKLAVVGSGQIGTSLVMSAAKADPSMQIVAYDVADIEASFFEALKRCGVPRDNVKFTTRPSDIAEADLVVLATPVGQFDQAIKTIAPYVNVNTVFTDVGSVKGLSQQRIRHSLDTYVGQDTSYVPFHILNGKEGSGPTAAGSTIFNAPGVLVPGQAPSNIENKIETFWRSLGTAVHKMSSDKHDMIFATTSHLEHAIMFSFMKSDFMNDLLDQRGNIDPGNWLQAMTRIAVAGPEMWAGNFHDNRDQILETAKYFRHSLVQLADKIEKDDPSLGVLIKELHQYAKDKKSDRITAYDLAITNGQDIRVSAFAGLISLALTSNVARVEKETQQPISAIANPSLKDGLGPIAIDPGNVSELLKKYREKIKPMVQDFLASFDRTISLVERCDLEAVKTLVREVSTSRNILPEAFAVPSAIAVPTIPTAHPN